MNHNSDAPFWIVAIVAVVVNLAWLGFLVWAIYELVTWLVTK